MGLLSKIKNAGNSIGVLARLCDKTWDLLESDDRISYVFKTDKHVHCIINGKSAIVPYVFIPDSGTLIISFFGVGGASYHLKHVDGQVLILFDEGTNEDLCFGNRNNPKAPVNEIEAYRCYFSKREQYFLLKMREAQESRFTSYYNSTDYIDKATEGLNEDDLISCINVFRKFIPCFGVDYVVYLGLYYSKHDPEYDYRKVDKSITDRMKWRVLSFKESIALNRYILLTGDSVYQHRIVLK